MSAEVLLSRYKKLSPELQKMVDLFLETLATKEKPLAKKGKATFGSAKVKILMADDFDAPLDAFKEYSA